MCKCKTKAIKTDLGTLRHNQTYPGIIQGNSGIFKTLCNSGIFRTVDFQNPDIFRHIQNPAKHLRWNVLQKDLTAIIIFANYNNFCSISLLAAFSASWNNSLGRYFRGSYSMSKTMVRGIGTVNFWYTHCYIQIN